MVLFSARPKKALMLIMLGSSDPAAEIPVEFLECLPAQALTPPFYGETSVTLAGASMIRLHQSIFAWKRLDMGPDSPRRTHAVGRAALSRRAERLRSQALLVTTHQ
jgi:hypothetical protein